MLRAGYHISCPAAEIVMSIGKERLHHRLIEGKHRIEPVPVSPSGYIESEETGRFMTIHTHDEEGVASKTAALCEHFAMLRPLSLIDHLG